jgi:hypothetical protein
MLVVLWQAVAYLSEMGYLFFQAAQVEYRHFNFSTPFHETMYGLMVMGAVFLIGMPSDLSRVLPLLG